MEENIETINSTNDEEITPKSEEPVEVGLPADPIEVEPKDDDTEDADALRQKNQDLYEQLRKAKGFKRDKDGKWVKPEPKPEKVEGTGDITKTELYSLVKANVPDEDVNEVVIYARSHGISATEALKLPEVKAILKVKQEYRTTAEATNTGGSRRGSAKISDEQLLANALKSGEMPDNDEDMIRLINARRAKAKS